MNRLDFALRTVRYVLDACNEPPTVPEDALVFASKVLVTLLPLLDHDRQRELTPAILQIIRRVPPAHRPVDLARSFRAVVDDELRGVIEALDATSRAARRAWLLERRETLRLPLPER